MHQDDPRARPWTTPTNYDVKIMTDKKVVRNFNHFNVKGEEDDDFVVVDKPAGSSTNGKQKGKSTKSK